MSQLRVPLYDLEKSAKPMVCAVTGATGFVGSALVKRLLAGGHTVHATVRNPDDSSRNAHLRALDGADKNLKFFKADLLDPSSFDSAFEGCSVVFHTASPFILSVPKSQVQDKLIRPAISGVEAALGAATRAGVETVILTSSVGAVWGKAYEHGEDHVITEEDWNISANEEWLPYYYSKTLAERRAWELEKEQTGPKKWRLCAINPGFVLGPPLSLTSPGESITFCKSMMAGQFKPFFRENPA